MKVKYFYEEKSCSKKAAFDRLLFTQNRFTVFAKAVKQFCISLTVSAPREALIAAKDYLESKYKQLDPNTAMHAEQYAHDDVMRIQRFYKHIATKKVIAVNKPTAFHYGDVSLEDTVHLILQCPDDASYHAFIIHTGTSKRSAKGRSPQTQVAKDLHTLVAKYSLEREYPHITIHSIHLSHGTDLPGQISPELEISGNKGANWHTVSYQEYYDAENGAFDYDKFSQEILGVMDAKEEKNMHKCEGCERYTLCHIDVIDRSVNSVSADNSSKVVNSAPIYSTEQKEIIHQAEGPMVVCAGGGSGKTTSLVGRVNYLIKERGVVPSSILVVTFSNSAIKQLKNCCSKFLNEKEFPDICTLHSFCHRLLKKYGKEVYGKTPVLLDETSKGILIENLLGVLPPLQGFKTTVVHGTNGYVSTVINRMKTFKSAGEEAFFLKYPDLGKDFVDFINIYDDIVKENFYIDFDDMVSLVIRDLFVKRPDILRLYQLTYQYVMVDEFQDVNKDQVDLVYALCQIHHNLVVVGDDDQGIYGFRGADVKYIREFTSVWPKARVAYLCKNYRSTPAIVNAARTVIEKNQDRIAKPIESGRTEAGVAPIMVDNGSVETTTNIIADLINKGYSYGDIAILSTKNSELERLQMELPVPTMLAKSYLRQDGLFLLARSISRLYLNGLHDDEAFVYFLALFDKNHLLSRTRKNLSLYDEVLLNYGYGDFRMGELVSGLSGGLAEELYLLQNAFHYLDANQEVSSFLDMCAVLTVWQGSDSLQVMKDTLKECNIKTLQEFMSYADNLIIFNDTKRVETVVGNRITLITDHDAKGKEWPVVLLRSDFGSMDEPVRRLLYVAATRPKELLYVMRCSMDVSKQFEETEENAVI